MSTIRQVGPLVIVFGGFFVPAGEAQVCHFQDPQHCQLFDNSLNFVQSDRDFGRSTIGRLAADDFVPTGSTLSEVCVWGLYLDYDPNAVDDDCGPTAVDHFVVYVYRNDGRRPLYYFGASMATSQRVEVPGTQIEAVLGNKVYQYTLTLNMPITNLITGSVYWLEVYNDVDEITSPTCAWQWSRRAASSDSYSFTSSDLFYNNGREAPFDHVFCTNFLLGQSPIGSMPGACCICGGSCTEQTLADCADTGGVWHIDDPTCMGVVCDSVPTNDMCGNAPLVPEGQYDFQQACARTDGYGPIQTDTGLWPMERDIWYRFIAPANCQLTINTCATPSGLDSMLAVYHNPDDPTTCPPCPLQSDPNGPAISASTLAGQAQDESCIRGTQINRGGEWIDSVQLGRTTLPGECFLIRAGVYPYGFDDFPTESVRIICHDENTPPPPQPDPSGLRKVRFISFQIPPEIAAFGQTAIRIHLLSMNRPVPPIGEAPIPWTAFDGLDVWVGPPQEYLESTASGIHFQAAKTQCTTYYRDWSTVGLLHVTGSAIVSDSVYRVEFLNSTCQGREGEFDCLSGGPDVSSYLEIKTSRWGEVETPYNPSPGQPDFADISALVNKFKNEPGAPIKARALLAGEDAFGSISASTMSLDVSFTQISACVDAFRGQPYPYKMGRCAGTPAPGESGACTWYGDCQQGNGDPPCTLYCP